MIVKRQRNYSIEDEARKKEYRIRHNARVSREEGSALDKLDKAYEGRLPNRDSEWEKYIEDTSRYIDEVPERGMDKVHAIRDIAKDIHSGVSSAFGSREVLETSGSGEKAKVRVGQRNLRSRVSDLKSGFEDLGGKYRDYKEGSRLERGMREADEKIKTPGAQTKEELEYEKKRQEIKSRYGARYI